MMLRSALAIFKRDFKKFLSNPFIIMMTLFMPIMYLVIFGNAFGEPSATFRSASYRRYHPTMIPRSLRMPYTSSTISARPMQTNCWTLRFTPMRQQPNRIWLTGNYLP